MKYKVQARIKQSKSEEFYQLLKGGSLEEQAPDGPEILASMDRATVDSSGLVRWTETCYCPTPLRHERATVYDKYFSDLQTEETTDHERFEGESFLKHISKN
ncbi:MAG: hypothetical protein IIC39_07590 [Candidatus Marinimicrobia bacterium]|nr:hypothetical protein [Candidatus Neomarinimicrobiota bacterium]